MRLSVVLTLETEPDKQVDYLEIRQEIVFLC